MANWFNQNWVGTAHSSTHSVKLIDDLPAGSVLCYLEARVQLSIASAAIANNTGDFFGGLTSGMAIGAVATGASSPVLDAFGATDDCIWYGGSDSHADSIMWGPSTADGFWWPYFTTTIKWRGARAFPNATDWYFVASTEAGGNDTGASGFFRLGFWS